MKIILKSKGRQKINFTHKDVIKKINPSKVLYVITAYSNNPGTNSEGQAIYSIYGSLYPAYQDLNINFDNLLKSPFSFFIKGISRLLPGQEFILKFTAKDYNTNAASFTTDIRRDWEIIAYSYDGVNWDNNTYKNTDFSKDYILSSTKILEQYL